jgi:hypothetical protein
MRGAKYSLRHSFLVYLKMRFFIFCKSIERKAISWFYQNLEEGSIEVNGWKFNNDYGFIYLLESGSDWKYYLPPGGVAGKKVLDLGGGCGETAKFFLDHGAAKVVVVESNPACWPYLDYNAERHEELVVFKEKAKLIHLGLGCDLVKMDVEGYELTFLPYLDDVNVDIVLEAHSNYIVDQFLLHGFSVFNSFKRNREITGGGTGGIDQLYRWRKIVNINDNPS